MREARRVEIDFSKLIRLQEIDSDLRQTSLYLDSLPRLIEEMDHKIQAGSHAVAEAKDKLARNQKRRRDLESEVKDAKAQIAKYKRQLNEVKSNKEYTGFLKEIEDVQKRVDAFEESIIAEMLAADDIEDEIKAALVRQDREAEGLRRDREVLLQKTLEMESRRAVLTKEREAILPVVPPADLKLYLAITGKKAGVALSSVKDDFCAACHMRIRPQMVNDIREAAAVILCENCGRILYWPPEKLVKPSKPAADKAA
jgi:predicted  nucleic acid-binding Zn-ribbon protein